jgi:hypothetical protein
MGYPPCVWPYREERLGSQVSVAAFGRKLGLLSDELLMQLASDGQLRVAVPGTPDVVVATVDLVQGVPWIEQLCPCPGLIRAEVSATWEEATEHVDPKTRSAARGPILLTGIEPGVSVDVYADAPPWEDGAVPTRSLTNDDIGGGWFIDHMQQVFAKSRVRLTVRRPTDADVRMLLRR